MANGAILAVEEMNAVGGYLGRPIELLIKDDEGTPEVGPRVSQELVDAGVLATVGFCNTGVAMRALPLFQDNRIPLIVPCAAGTPVSKRYAAPESYVFRMSARDEIQAPFVIDDLVRRGWTRVAIFADDTPYGESGLVDATRALEARGLKPVHVTRFPLGTDNLQDEMRRAREAGANVVFAWTVGPENAVIARSRLAIGWRVPMVGGWTLSFPLFIEGAGAAAEGALMAQTFIAEPNNERRRAFLASYTRRFQVDRIPVPMAAAQAHDAMYVLMYAMLGIRDGQLTGPRLKASLENLSRTYYGVVSTYERPFSRDDKDAFTRNMLVLGEVRNGRVTYAYEEDLRRGMFVQRKQQP